ncbi:2-deoxy-D-gluconate 3-dehydrogenase [Pseudoclavibacter sp. RFBG4]|uniref:SDR family oxidoreductase n=1 Tax=Pseudoclavibacter sp. RFBG4 TaxID=2080575 RepID=UPI000CE8FF2E|nr:SDR family oxidoreductase [Pseudoclavibacter sp. RFBG4]PPG35721.1 2-deoxy-D-gluconate 3-dehydrogenase [Pseudoclavibacter sp. RFBG4]
MTSFDLTGKTAVVTGARRGIGLGIATALAEAGADIIAASSQQETDGGEVGARVRSLGRSFEGHGVDFTDRAAVEQFGASVKHADILVNNAGTIRRAPAAEHSLDWWDEVIQVNLSSQFVLSQIVGAAMVERGDGRIIFTASLLSFQGGINVPGYTASKSAIAGLVHALSNEWASRGVTVNAIAPGYIATDNTEALREDSDRSRSILERIPAGRWGEAEDLGGAAVFLASPAAAYVTGVVLPVDGGWLAR